MMRNITEDCFEREFLGTPLYYSTQRSSHGLRPLRAGDEFPPTLASRQNQGEASTLMNMKFVVAPSAIAQVAFVSQPAEADVYHIVLGPVPIVGTVRLELGPATPAGCDQVSTGCVELMMTVKVSGTTTPEPVKSNTTV